MMPNLKVYLDLMNQPCRALYIFMEMNSIPFDVKTVALRKGEYVPVVLLNFSFLLVFIQTNLVKAQKVRVHSESPTAQLLKFVTYPICHLPLKLLKKQYVVVKLRDIPISKLLAKCWEIISLVDFLSLVFREICHLISSHEY